jgi:magnesium chelatase family protein
VEVAAVTRTDLTAGATGESSRVVSARVAAARAAQRQRLAGTAWRRNGEVPGTWLREQLRLSPRATRELDAALDRGRLSVRGYDRVLRIAWTLADLSGTDRPGRDDLGRALLLRQRGRVAA